MPAKLHIHATYLVGFYIWMIYVHKCATYEVTASTMWPRALYKYDDNHTEVNNDAATGKSWLHLNLPKAELSYTTGKISQNIRTLSTPQKRYLYR